MNKIIIGESDWEIKSNYNQSNLGNFFIQYTDEFIKIHPSSNNESILSKIHMVMWVAGDEFDLMLTQHIKPYKKIINKMMAGEISKKEGNALLATLGSSFIKRVDTLTLRYGNPEQISDSISSAIQMAYDKGEHDKLREIQGALGLQKLINEMID